MELSVGNIKASRLEVYVEAGKGLHPHLDNGALYLCEMELAFKALLSLRLQRFTDWKNVLLEINSISPFT